MDKVNKNDDIILTGYMNVRVRNTKISSMVGENGEAALNICKTLRDFCTVNDLKIMNTFEAYKNP
jgi:hypothetical protein